MQKSNVIKASIASTTAVLVLGALIWKKRQLKSKSKRKRKKKSAEAVSVLKTPRRRKKNAEKLHKSEMEEFKASISVQDAAEFDKNYRDLESSFTAHPMSDAKAVEVNKIGNLITFMLQTRSLIATDPRNADMLIETANQFPDEVEKVADHIPDLGRKLIVAQAKKLAESITRGVRAANARAH